MVEAELKNGNSRPGRKWPAWVINALLVVCSTLFALGAAELILRYYIKPRQVLDRQLLSGFALTDADQNWHRDAELGWAVNPSTTFRHTAAEFDTAVRTDDLGLRVPLDFSGRRAFGDRNILFIGDSGTAAYEVAYEETFVAKVEAALRAAGQNVRAFNAGVRGYSTEQSYKRMRRLLDALPGITDVVFQWGINDPFENMSLHQPYRLFGKPGAYLDENGALRFRALTAELGIGDAEAVFLEPGGAVGTLPAIGREGSLRRLVSQKVSLRDPSGLLQRLYIVTVTQIALELLSAPPADVAVLRARYPYLNFAYARGGYGGQFPASLDVSWEAGSYPLGLTEEIVRTMGAEAKRRGKRFWFTLPLTASPTQAAFFREIARKHDIRLVDPVSDGLRDRWATQCGGTLAFQLDSHYHACGHTAHADAVLKALAAP